MTEDLHGQAPDRCAIALLLVDMINDLEFEGGASLLKQGVPLAERLADLAARAREAGVPVIYVNDNMGRWRDDFGHVVEACLNSKGRPLVDRLRPQKTDYFVLKPKNSGFFSTPLDLLLEHLGARVLVLTGIAGNNCILFTANDAYLREYAIVVPPDGVISIEPQENEVALRLMADVCKARLVPTREVDFTELGAASTAKS